MTALAASVLAEDRRTDPSRLVVMTLNAEFLWDGHEPEEGQVSFLWRGAPDEADEHLEEIADIIVAHDPDIVNLCEVENLETLQRLNNEFLAGMGYAAYLDKGRDTYTGQDVGLLTRIDPEGGSIVHDERTGRSGTTTKSVSKNYVAKFDVGGRKIGLVALHFLARPASEDRRPSRQAQADAVRKMAVDLGNGGYDVIVLGDFNDYDGAPDCRPLRVLPPARRHHYRQADPRERLRHQGDDSPVFAAARTELQLQDHFGESVEPREWFFVPLSAEKKTVEIHMDGRIGHCEYDPATAQITDSMSGKPE